MRAIPNRTLGRKRQTLLSAYTETYGAALRRSQSMAALRAARVDSELAYRARGAFLASMNHELRTPLNAITGFAGLLKHTPPEATSVEKRDEYLDYILNSAEVLLSHIDMILAISDAESGGTSLARRAFDIRDVVRQTVEQMEGQDSVPTIDLPRRLPLVDADPDKIGEALGHVVAFIQGASNEPQPIKISARAGLGGRSAGFLYVAIECPGTVIPESDIRAAFRVFDQFHEGLDRRFEGHAIGLPIAKSYIELNRGRFNVKSTEDTGVLIRFALPVAAAEHQEMAKGLAQ